MAQLSALTDAGGRQPDSAAGSLIDTGRFGYASLARQINANASNAAHPSRHRASEIIVTAKEPYDLAPEEIEEIEKLTLRWIFQAVSDFGMEAHVYLS